MTPQTVLYVCVHNAGRSQMAEAFTNALARARDLPVFALSAGTVGGKTLNAVAVEVMEEVGISMAGQTPKLMTDELVNCADKIISMGCGVDAEACPARFVLTEDWELEDPDGQPIEKVREIREEIKTRVAALLEELARS